jgi:hypothetical protein
MPMRVGAFLKSINIGTGISVVAALASVYSAFQANALLQEQTRLLAQEASSDIKLMGGNRLVGDYVTLLSAQVCLDSGTAYTSDLDFLRGYYLYYFASSEVTLSNVGGRSVSLLNVSVSEPDRYFLGEVYERGKSEKLAFPTGINPGESRVWLLAASESKRLTRYDPLNFGTALSSALSVLADLPEWKPSGMTWTLSFGDGKTLAVETRVPEVSLHRQAAEEVGRARSMGWSIECNDRLATMRRVWASAP